MQPSLNDDRGFLTLEALVGLSLLLTLTLGVSHLLMTMWLQLKVEDAAQQAADLAARVPAPAATHRATPILEGLGTTQVYWGEEYVWVRVQADGRRAVAERLLPRESW